MGSVRGNHGMFLQRNCPMWSILPPYPAQTVSVRRDSMYREPCGKEEGRW